jgi:putative ABC transport system permease protein
MLRLTLKNLAANKTRFALTTFGVMLAVSFVVSAFVLGDGLRSSFTTVSEDITAGVDLEIRNVAEFGDAPPLAFETVANVGAVDGVAEAVASIEAANNAVRPIKANGDSITTNGPPQLAFNWINNQQLSPFTLVEGTPPEVGEFTIDYDSAAKHDFVIGETYELITPDGRIDLTLSGTSSFGPDNSTLGAVLMQMNTAEASAVFAIDGISTVNVELEEGADASTVLEAVAAAVPSAEVVDNATVLAETTSEFTDEIDVIGNILLGFGGVALFVSIFIIYNTFAIVLSQRTRELALLRTVGAGPKQIQRSVLGEAFVIGVLASVGGIGGGIAVAKGLEALFGLIGADLPEYPIILATRTLVAAVVIGIGITMLAAIGPARKASTIPPIAALRGGAEATAPGSRTRKISGVALFAVGIGAGTVGLAGVGSTGVTVAFMAVGAVGVFLGVTILSPLAVGLVTTVFGWPMRKVAGVAGKLAQKNAARNSRRTASTAAALMIGLALVTTALVFGQSVKASIVTTFDDVAIAEYYVTDDLEDVEFPTTLAAEIRKSEAVDAATGFRYIEARMNETVTDVAAVEFDQLPLLLDIDIGAGGLDTAVANPMLISADEADALQVGVGDTITAEFPHGTTVEATIAGIFHDQVIMVQDYVFDISVFDNAGVDAADEWVAFSIPDGADTTIIDALIVTMSEQFPQGHFESGDEFQKRIVGFIDETLAVVNVMVALAVIIALIGIANTLALSVFERTRELGLIRAVGMTRRQLRRMVRFEAALVATFGAVLGVGIGILFGSGIVTALPDSLASSVSIPVQSIAILILIAASAGMIAAWLPARRAGRLNVLDAIAH